LLHSDLSFVTPAPQTLTIGVRENASGSRVLTLSGPLTIQTLFDFQAVVRAGTGKALILDFAAVPYMDSAGLGSVINAYTSCQRLQRGFAIAGMSQKINTLLKVTGVDGVLPCFESVAAAEEGVSALGS
jgi:anti-anti-sigma factor